MIRLALCGCVITGLLACESGTAEAPVAAPSAAAVPVPSALPKHAPVPVPEPVVEPASQPAAPSGAEHGEAGNEAVEVPPDLSGSTVVAGRWSGSLSGVFLEVVLKGSDERIRGRVGTTWKSQANHVDVAGAFDPKNGNLTLTELGDGPNPTTYSVSLTKDGRSLRGRVLRENGQAQSIQLSRSSP